MLRLLKALACTDLAAQLERVARRNVEVSQTENQETAQPPVLHSKAKAKTQTKHVLHSKAKAKAQTQQGPPRMTRPVTSSRSSTPKARPVAPTQALTSSSSLVEVPLPGTVPH